MKSRSFLTFSLLWVVFLTLLLAPQPVSAGVVDIDFGLAIFGGEEIRLEKAKSPDFNVTLLRKYIIENAEKPLFHMHGLSVLANLIRQSEELRAEELKELARGMFRTHLKGKLEPTLLQLGEVFFEGLVLAISQEPDPKNIGDRLLEDRLLKSEDTLAELPEYWLVKGVIFHLLAGRPNGYFTPMKPVEDLKLAVSKAKADPHFFFVLGQAFRSLGNNDQNLYFSIQSFERAATLNPTNGRLQNTLLGLYMGLHEGYQGNRKSEPFWLEEAVYKKILTLHPSNPHALNNLGYLYAEYGIHRQDAQILCQRAVDQMPKNPSFRDSLGWAAFKNGNIVVAERELSKAISMNADMYDPYYHLGTVHYVSKRFEQAIEMYEKAITIKPGAAESLNNYAYLLTELDREIPKALQMAKKAAAIEPNNPSYIDTLAWAEFKMGNSEEALRLLRRALQLAPDVGEILAHAGRVNLHLKNVDEAYELFKRAFKADPNLDSIQKDLYMVIQTRATYQAIAEYHQLLGEKANPRHVTGLLLNLTRLHQEEGNFKEAIAITQLCDRLHRQETLLNAPLFPFYSLPNRPASEAATAQTSPGEIDGEEIDDQQGLTVQSLEGTDFPAVARIPLGVFLGPVFFRNFQHLLAAFPGIDQLSLALFIRNLREPYQNSILRFEFPGLGQKDTLAVLGYFFHWYGTQAEVSSTEGERPVLLATFGNKPVWALQQEDQTFIGMGSLPEIAELASLSQTFPYAEEALTGFLLDWAVAKAEIPTFAAPFIGNPLGPFHRLYATYRRTAPEVREVAFLEPAEAINPKLMQKLTEDLFFHRILLFKLGIKASIRIEANDGGIRLNTDYSGIKDALQNRGPLLKIVYGLFRTPIDRYWCQFRRALFGGGPEELKNVCPSGGSVILSPHTGALNCSEHEGFGYFPCPLNSSDRCSFSRTRIEMIRSLLPHKKFKTEGLLNQIHIDYNVPPCPHGGVFVFDAAGKVSCSIHSKPGPVTAPSKLEKQEGR